MTAEGTIVVGVDGSAHAERAVAWAGRQAALERRAVRLVAVGDDGASLADRAAEALARTRPDVEVQTCPGAGDPREVLLELSREAHLLVVGSRGMGAVRSLLLGSVSSAVSAHAACPVVVCRPQGTRTPRGIVVGADGTVESLPVIEFAFRQADLHAQPLTVVHGFWDAAVAVAQYRLAQGRDAREPDLEELQALLAVSVAGMGETYPDVQVSLVLKHGFVEEALAPRHDGLELIVVGRHPGSAAARLMQSSVSSLVLERAQGPVAVVPEQAAT